MDDEHPILRRNYETPLTARDNDALIAVYHLIIFVFAEAACGAIQDENTAF